MDRVFCQYVYVIGTKQGTRCNKWVKSHTQDNGKQYCYRHNKYNTQTPQVEVIEA